jgi:hypothetical protein
LIPSRTLLSLVAGVFCSPTEVTLPIPLNWSPNEKEINVNKEKQSTLVCCCHNLIACYFETLHHKSFSCLQTSLPFSVLCVDCLTACQSLSQWKRKEEWIMGFNC